MLCCINSPDESFSGHTGLKEVLTVLFFICYLIRYVCSWGHLTPGTPEWSRGRQSGVHHHPHTLREAVPLRQLELQRDEHHHLHQRQRHWARTCQQDLAGPNHGVPGAQEPGAGGQRRVRCHHHTRRRAAETGEDHTERVWWVWCSECLMRKDLTAI